MLGVGLPGVIIFALGFPFVNWLVLYLHRTRLHEGGVKAVYGFLYEDYEPGFWFWDVVITARKLLIIVASLGERDTGQACTAGHSTGPGYLPRLPIPAMSPKRRASAPEPSTSSSDASSYYYITYRIAAADGPSHACYHCPDGACGPHQM